MKVLVKTMIDIAILRNNPELVKENMKKKFQHNKLHLVDEAYDMDIKCRQFITKASDLRGKKNQLSREIGKLFAAKKIEEANAIKQQIADIDNELLNLEKQEEESKKILKEIMMKIPNFISDDVPIGKDDSENVELEKFGEPALKSFEVPYHLDIMESFNGIDLDSARKVAGNGFYYLQGDIARLHSAVIAYARDFMINKGFTYVVPPFMIRSNVVTGVMSF